jgi:hypothetical protein
VVAKGIVAQRIREPLAAVGINVAQIVAATIHGAIVVDCVTQLFDCD